eukprot:CAMPEP_0181224000 /NCGR_PEP_ID=MMETSP1096-20121128/30870_1 /TAXON_ID=156174 ORGANISM="Chrysochromulina ericina, Strain CCMP281" /NCGR_SAMPLE_ID=MMETSP1096 /ASSEMBLY_ACC=CAM_ASM_000453 /LENGTH=86 /DNA_ID=CAMNT_0023317007 /DNA_START=227 /DNA_END=490 /DNA_ORIENTATION=+
MGREEATPTGVATGREGEEGPASDWGVTELCTGGISTGVPYVTTGVHATPQATGTGEHAAVGVAPGGGGAAGISGGCHAVSPVATL